MSDRTGLFREEALAAQQAGADEGAPLQLMPQWTRWSYWVLVLTVIAALVYAGLVSVREFAEGPAVVRVKGRFDVMATTGGLVEALLVKAGDRVETGQMLLKLASTAEQQEIQKLEQQFEAGLTRFLAQPNDEATREGLSQLREQQQALAARIRENSIIAPAAGVVSNLRVRAGQLLAAGEVALTLIDEKQASYSVVALLPGQYRPVLRPGMVLRFELQGYANAHHALAIASVSDEVVGPAESRRFLGHEVGDALPVQGALVVVRARLPSSTFSHGSRTLRYYDGIPGRIEVAVGSNRLIVSLLPFLRRVIPDGV